MEQTKVCRGCDERKSLDCFGKARKGLRAMCKLCVARRKSSFVEKQAANKAVSDADTKTINNAFNLWFGRVRRGLLSPTV